jgi:hypothetical protein
MGVLLAQQFHLAQADFMRDAAQSAIGIAKRARHRIERLSAIACGPPALRMGDVQRQGDMVLTRDQIDAAFKGHGRPIRRGDGRAQGEGTGMVGLNREARHQPRRGIAQRFLRHAHRVDPRAVPCLKVDIAPWPDVDDARAPVPAVMILGLADIGRGLLALGLVAIDGIIFAGQRMGLPEHHRLERLDR